MRVTIDESGRFFTLEPTTLEEYDDLLELSLCLGVGEELKYEGSLAFYSLPESTYSQPNESSGPLSLSQTKIRFRSTEGKILELSGENSEDVWNIQQIQETCSGRQPPSIIFVGWRQLKDMLALDFTIGHCKKCGRFCVDRRDLNFMCSECANTCLHNYMFLPGWRDGDGEEYGGEVRVKSLCKHCWRPDPDFVIEKYSSEEHKILFEALFK